MNSRFCLRVLFCNYDWHDSFLFLRWTYSKRYTSRVNELRRQPGSRFLGGLFSYHSCPPVESAAWMIPTRQRQNKENKSLQECLVEGVEVSRALLPLLTHRSHSTRGSFLISSPSFATAYSMMVSHRKRPMGWNFFLLTVESSLVEDRFVGGRFCFSWVKFLLLWERLRAEGLGA